MRRVIGVSGATAMTLLLVGCAPQHTVGGPPPSGWEPGPGYAPPQVHLFTADMVSDFAGSTDAWNGFGFSECAPRGFVIGMSHTYAPPVSGDPPVGRPLEGEERRGVLSALEDGISLIRVRDGASVPVRVQEGCVDVNGTVRSLQPTDAVFRSLVPSEPLEDGWYVFRADLSLLRATGLPFSVERSHYPVTGQEVVEDILYARVRWGSAASWARVVFSRGSSQWQVAAVASQPALEVGRTTVEVIYDDEVVPCAPPAVADDAEVVATGVECPAEILEAEAADRTIHITLRETSLALPSGAPATTLSVPFDAYWRPNDATVAVLFAPEFAMEFVRNGAP